MAEQSITHDDDEPEYVESDLDHEHRIVDRVLDMIAPDELPCDVDPESVAFLLWMQLTSILFLCGHTVESLVDDVQRIRLEDSEPEGAA
jgi:hypothetical protein